MRQISFTILMLAILHVYPLVSKYQSVLAMARQRSIFERLETRSTWLKTDNRQHNLHTTYIHNTRER